MLVSRNAYRAVLLHLSVNPLLSRASISTGTSSSITTSFLQPQTSTSRLYTILFPQCAPNTRNTEPNIRHAHSMANPTLDSVAGQIKENNTPDFQHQEPQPQAESKEEQFSSREENLYLPASKESTEIPTEKQIRLDLSGDGVKLDHLGPMVVNVDGTLSRIGNWAQMTEMERKNTLRVLGRRNKQRLEALKAREAGEGRD